MTFRLVSISLEARTANSIAQYSTRFYDGINVLAAPNSWGKSTLIQAIVYGLGLEGMLSASRQSPLGEAMTSVVETGNGREAVFESSVTLTISNDRGDFLRVRRRPRSFDIGNNLIETWTARSESDLDVANQVDTFVRERGAATNELGFHFILQRFIGWELPTVPSYSDRDTLLYMELLFPLFYIEQKFGWAGISPRVPTYLGVREPLRRAVEFLLSLSTLERIKRRAALRDEQAEIAASWAAATTRLLDSVIQNNWQVVGLQERPVGSSTLTAHGVFVTEGENLIALETALEGWRAELEGASDPNATVPTAESRTSRSNDELLRQEQEYRRTGARLRASQENLSLGRADLEALDRKLAEIEQDRRRLTDAGRLARMGSTLDISLVSAATCPTCAQQLDGRAVPTGAVRSLEETSTLTGEERDTLRSLRASIEARVSEAEARTTALGNQLREIRAQIRLLRDELAGPSGAASVVEVRQRIADEERLLAADRVLATSEAVFEDLALLAERLDTVRAQLAELAESDDDAADTRAIAEFARRFVEQLGEYGLRSLPPDSVTIDPASFVPVNDGAELVFNVSTGMSASDTVRTKWAYYAALLETALSVGGNHPGVLIVDEPRQQEADRASLRAFAERVGALPGDQQVLWATSEPIDELSVTFANIPYHPLPAGGTRLLS